MKEHLDDSFAVVTLGDGCRLRGRRDGDGAQFLGVPYAAPPVGALRWRPPAPPAPWSGVRDALAFGADVPQAPDPHFRAPRQDEDCLTLNIWTPTLARDAKLPVLVWVYGGGFTGGSGSDDRCDGPRLAAEGAVVVTINYRCGLFGFLAHPALSEESEHGVSGNYGLLDQMAAFGWIKEHVSAFGGDPQRVTGFGYSAGSASLSLLLTAPRAAGLFQRAILQSPGSARPLASLAEAETAGLALGTDLAALRTLSAGEVLARTSLLTPAVRSLTRARVLRPIRDGWLLREDERAAFRAGHLRRMPMIVGSNVDEGSLLTRTWPVDTVAAWREQVDTNFAAHAAEAAALYPASEDAQARHAVAQMFADTQFNDGTRLLAQAMAKQEARTWKYLFGRRRPGQQDGPQHGDEVPYVFGTLAAAGGAWAPEDEALSRTMRRAWVAFAANGDPNRADAPLWAPYRATEDNHLALDVPPVPGAGWRRSQLDFLDRFFG